MLWNGLGLALMSGGGASLFQQVFDMFNGGTVKGGLYDISDLSTLFSDRSATPSTPAVVDGVVGTVLDLSGNGSHLIAPSDGARPILRTSGGRYWLEGDGTDDILVASFSSQATTSLLMVACGQLSSTGSTANDDIFSLGNSANANPFAFLRRTAVDALTGSMQAGWRSMAGADVSQIWAAGESAVGGVRVFTNVVGSNVALRTDGAQRLAGGSPASATFDRIAVLGLQRTSASNFCPGRFYGGVALLNSTPTESMSDACERWAASLGGVTLHTSFVIAEGDSITAASDSYATQAYEDLGSPVAIIFSKPATNGATMATLETRASATDAALKPGIRNLLTILIGTNDYGNDGDSAAVFLSELESYLDDRIAAGWRTGVNRIAVATLLPRDDATFTSTFRPAANAGILALHGVKFDYLLDFASHAIMGPDAAALNATLYSDGLHPTALGSSYLAAVYASVLN